MANVNAAKGLRPVRHYFGGTVRANDYALASGVAASIFYGDPVKSTGTTKQITVAAAGNTILGAFAGCFYSMADGEVRFSPYWAQSTPVLSGSAIVALVYDDPGTLFEIQASAGFAVTDVGTVADVVAGSGNTSTGDSGFQLDSATFSAAGSATLKVVELAPRPDNAYGTNAKVLVLINEHELRAAMTAV